MPTSLGESSLEVAPPPPRSPAAKPVASLWGEDGFTFGDLLDIVNPLQHIPVISQLYRELTGDDIGYAPQVMGGALFGGVIGLIASLINVIVDDETGKDIGEHAVAMLFGDDPPGSEPGAPQGEPTVMVASAETTPMSDAADFAAEAPPPLPAADRPPVEYAGVDAITPMNDSIFLAQAPLPPPLSPAPSAPPVALASSAPPVALASSAPPVAPASSAPAPARLAAVATQARAEPVVPAAPDASFPGLAAAKGGLAATPASLRNPGGIRANVAAARAAAPVVPVAPILSAPGLSAPILSASGLSALGPATGTVAPALAAADAGRPLASLFEAQSSGAAVPGPWVADAMMSGLDKYRAMALDRVRAKPEIDDEF